MTAGATVADLLARRLRDLGVGRIYGLPLADLDHVGVDDPALAVILADADGRIGHVDGRGRLGAALLAGPILHLSSAPGGRAPLQSIGSPEELLDALVDVPGVDVPGTVALHLDLDLTEPVPDDLVASLARERTPVVTLDPSMAALHLVIVAGPGVVRAGGLDGLAAFSRVSGTGILNTFGAKGVERWDSPFHLGTAGLQADDVLLAGLAEADVVIASGLDPDELGIDDLDNPVVQEVPPGQLGALGLRWESRPPPGERPLLYEALASVVTPLYESDAVPLTAARASLHLSGALPDRGIAVVDPGLAGFWTARTFPTSIPGSICVPATAEPGFAVAAAAVCALEGRPCLAVTDDEGLSQPETVALLDWAGASGKSVALQVWGDGGELRSTADHVDLLEAHLGPGGVRVDHVPVDFGATEELTAVAGAVTAWS